MKVRDIQILSIPITTIEEIELHFINRQPTHIVAECPEITGTPKVVIDPTTPGWQLLTPHPRRGGCIVRGILLTVEGKTQLVVTKITATLSQR